MKISTKLLLLFTFICLSFSGSGAVELSLYDALKIGVENSSRGAIISGDLEVAKQQYHAEKINFYLPEISIEGNVPVYNVTESFGNVYGQNDQVFFRRTNLNYNANLSLNQSLITGGEFLVKGQLVNNKTERPQTTFDGGLEDVTQKDRQGVFDFSLTQPLLKPSEPKNRLHNKEDDLEIARISKVDETTKLKDEIIEAYFGKLVADLKVEIAESKVESGQLKKNIDSLKLVDEVLSEEQYLETSSAYLDAELESFDAVNEYKTKTRELAILLDFEATDEITASTPVVSDHISDQQKERFINGWENSNAIKKANLEYRKAERSANYAAGGHGLTGMLTANYTVGRGKYEDNYRDEDNNTDSWGLQVNFSLPLWDGGSKGAELKAARLSAQKSEMELERAKKTQKAEIINLINQLDICYRKIDVLNKQIELAKNKLDIADYRYNDGQISRVEYLESKVSYLEAKNKYLDELKEYFKNRVQLEGHYSL